MAIIGSQIIIQGVEHFGLLKGIKDFLWYGHGIFVKTHLDASKIFCTYLLACFLLENTKKTILQISNLLLTFQNK
jgi:hypothetical protein